jgi:dihydrofolate synthase/folylpolyglutamate synthase
VKLGDALEWLDGHQNLERMLADHRSATPDPARMRELMDVLGDPQQSLPVIHLTGTNGKTSTARALTQLLMAKGLSVGTFTSPHLERINERISANGVPITDDDLAEVLTGVAATEALLDDRPTWFELITATALRWFADLPVDVAVIEVGLGGRWDATNVVDGVVSVVTNVGLDHLEFLGPTRADVAKEKAGIVEATSTLVLGEADPALYPIFAEERPAQLWWRGRDYEVEGNDLAVGGRLLDLRTPGATYNEVFLALHGRYQATNFIDALVAAEAFFGAPIEPDLVATAAATVRSPGRLEIVGRQPLIILDGAKNVEGARALAASLAEGFGDVSSRILVIGMLQGKDPTEMLEALDTKRARLVVACPAPSPRTQHTEAIAAAASSFGCPTLEAGSVPAALDLALRAAEPEDLVLVTGSLYVVGAARASLSGAPR